MSAFVVGKPHIDALVAVAAFGPSGVHLRNWLPFSYYHGAERREVNDLGADRLGAMLWTENERSVAYRYNDRENLPGPIEREEPAFYRFTHSKMFTPRPTAIEALKLIRCYEYQSCEHPGWESSEAKAFCDTMTHALVACLPGYDDAPWEWTGDAGQARSVAR